MELIMLRFIRRTKPVAYPFCELKKYVTSSRIGGQSSERLYEVYAGTYRNETLHNFKRNQK